MTRGASLLLALGFASAALLYGGVWQYGDGFIFNRFNGQVIYVDLPDDEEAVRLRARVEERGSAHPLRVLARRSEHVRAQAQPRSERPARAARAQPSA